MAFDYLLSSIRYHESIKFHTWKGKSFVVGGGGGGYGLVYEAVNEGVPEMI